MLTELAHPSGRAGFEQLVPAAVQLRLGATEVQLIALDDLIDTKASADRPKDHDALPELRQLRDNAPS